MKPETNDLNGAMQRNATGRTASKKSAWLFAACAVSAMSGPCNTAFATEISGSIGVTATVIDTCTVQTDQINFGDIGPNQSATYGAGVAVSCTGQTLLDSVYLSMGDNSNAGSRRLASTAPGYIPYTVSVGVEGAGDIIEATDATTDVSNAFGHYFPGSPDNWVSVVTATIGATPTARATGEYTDTLILTVNYSPYVD